MSNVGKLQPIIILAAAGIGLALGQAITLPNTSLLIEIFLMMLLYTMFATVSLKKLGESLKNIKYTASSLIINFVITPQIAFMLGAVFFPEQIDIRIGLLMLLVTPCTDWYLIFTALAKGNVELNMSILPLNLILQIALLPVYLFIFLGSEISINTTEVTMSVATVLLIPFFLALVTKFLIKNNPLAKEKLDTASDNLQLTFLCLAVVAMFASEGANIIENPMLFVQLFIPLIIFFALNFAIGQATGRMLKFSKPDVVALNFTTLARNSPLSLAVAVAMFPDSPNVALALVIGPLIELPILSIVAWGLKRWNMRN